MQQCSHVEEFMNSELCVVMLVNTICGSSRFKVKSII